MGYERRKRHRLLVSCAVWIALLAAPLAGPGSLSAASAVPIMDGWRSPSPLRVDLTLTTTALAPNSGRLVHRWTTRVEHSMTRLGAVMGQVGILWLWMLLSAGAFLVVAAFASVADLRMFDMRQRGPGELSRYLGYGLRTFFRILRDYRHTPYLAYSVLGVALIYWVNPFDVVADSSLMPGFIDDLIVTIVAAKAFIYLCPDSLVALHASAVDARTHA
jgi:uncharacterized membrane protein YkvA (DUF1232 family)